MNKFGSLIVAAMVAASATSVVLAQGMGGGQSGMDMMKMDANGDGVISKEEYMKYHEAMFDHMKNKDGVVSMKDMPAGCGMGSGSMMKGGKGSGQGMMGDHGKMGGQGMMGDQGGGAKKTP